MKKSQKNQKNFRKSKEETYNKKQDFIEYCNNSIY